MDFYRVFVWNGISQENELIKSLQPPRERQGSGRHDIPAKDGVIYCSKSPVSAIAELLQGFRGSTITNKVFSCPDGKVRALIRIAIGKDVNLIDLNDPKTLLKLKWKPSQVASMQRAITQNISRLLFDKGVDGFTWWSILEASWVNATLFQSRIVKYINVVGQVITLETKLPEVVEAAKILKIRIET